MEITQYISLGSLKASILSHQKKDQKKKTLSWDKRVILRKRTKTMSCVSQTLTRGLMG